MAAADKDTFAPINTVVGWNEGIGNKKDAAEIAKGYIKKRFTAIGSSWYAVKPFLGGYFWEVQEGGQGHGYIDAVIEALSDDPSKEYWFPSGDRAFRVMMRDGKPFGVLLSEAQTEEVFASGMPPLLPKSKMFRAERRGTGTLAFGAAMSGIGAVYMLSAMGFYAFVANPGPSVPAANFAELPHAQWNRVVGAKVTEIVAKLQYKDDNWEAVMRAHEVPGLQELKDKTQSLLDKVKEGIQPMPATEPDRFSSSAPSTTAPQSETNAPSQPAAEEQPSSAPDQASVDALKEEIARKNAEQSANKVDGNNGAGTISPEVKNEGGNK